MSFVWNPLTSALNPSLNLDLQVFRWWLTGRRGRMHPKALDSIHKQHLGTDKWYQFKIKRLELILGLSSASALGERLWVFALLSRLAWVIVLILRPGGGNLSPVSSKMMLFSDIFCLFFYFNQWFNCFRVYEFSPSDASSLSIRIIIITYFHAFRLNTEKYGAIILAPIWFFSRSHVFCVIQSMPVNLQKYHGEWGAFYSCSWKYMFAWYSYEFNSILLSLLASTFLCLVYFVVIFFKALKNCFDSSQLSFLFSFERAVVPLCKLK